MKKSLLTALALVVAAGGTLALTAFRGHHGDPARMERFVTNRVDDLLDDVQATDAQRQQILALKDKLLADEFADALLKVHAILTPEQRATLTKKIQRHHEE